MKYIIKHVTTEQELDAALELDKRVFGVSSELSSPDYSREKWLSRMKTHANLMLYAEVEGEVVSIVFGRVEGGKSVTVGPVAVDERFRKHGIASALMLELERRTLAHGIRHLSLGAVESAEGFYEKLGYKGTLLLQSEKHSVEELLSLNSRYRVKSTGVYQGTVSQVFIELPAPDREFRRYCEATLPGCHTQTVFNKNI